MISYPFEVGDYIRVKDPHKKIWDYNRFHNPLTDGNQFLVTEVDLYIGRFRIDGFKGFTGWWYFDTVEKKQTFELCEKLDIEKQIVRRINKLYAKCKTTAHWSK